MASLQQRGWPPSRFSKLEVNTSPIKLHVEMRDEETDELLQYLDWSLDIQPKFTVIPLYNPDSEIKTVRMLSLGMILHVIAIIIAMVAILIHMVRFCSNCMTIDVKYSMIVKKFESGSNHLELN